MSFNDELIEEIKFITRCHGKVKPVRKRRSEEDDNNSEDNIGPFSTPYNGFSTETKQPFE